MSNRKDLPFNVTILDTTSAAFDLIRPVTSLDYFESANGDLHDEGLFSLSIFGRMGDPVRDGRFSYIDTRVHVFHPFIYRTLIQLRAFYRDLIAGKQYAIWDPKARDFVQANELTGRTGYAFFMEHWKDIHFNESKSPIRASRIRLIEKYKNVATTNRIVVIPAGLRDIEVGDDGRSVVAEINPLYRRVISIARTIPKSDYLDDPTYDLARNMLQGAFGEIYDYLEKMLTGKSGFLQSRWGSRRIFNGTRNVLTTMNVPVPVLGAPNAPKFTDTVVGLYQLARAALPITKHGLYTSYMSEVLAPGNGMARVVDPLTFEGVTAELPMDVYDRWNTMEGLEKIVNGFRRVEKRHLPVMLGKWGAALIYAPKNQKVFRVFHDISELPATLDRKDVRLITMGELLYLSNYRKWNTLCGIVTRYPVTGIGSTYPTTIYVKTTVIGETRRELGPDWEPLPGDEHLALEFPVYEPLAWVDSLVIPSSRLVGMGADFDGDTGSLNITYSEESLTEIRDLLTRRRTYVDPRGGLMASVSTLTSELVFRNFTRNPENPNNGK